MATMYNKSNNNTTMNDQQQQQHNEQQQNQDYQRSDYYNNYYNTHASGRVLPAEAGERIRDAYIDNVSDRMTGAAAKIIEDAYTAGMTVEQIIMAIEDTGLAPRPSPAYLRAILQEWARCGVSVSRSNRDVRPCKAKPWWR